MARPRKIEEKNRIRDVAFTLISKSGFDNTSISDIAKEADISKSLVQYYFPKKDQFLSDFINRSLGVVETIVNESELKLNGDIERLWAIAYLQYYCAMYNPKMNFLRMDILKDRSITNFVSKEAIEWITKNTTLVEVGNLETQRKIELLLNFIIGGAIDYLYNCLYDDQDVDLEFLSEAAVLLFNPVLKEEDQIFGKIEVADQMSPEWLKESRKKYNKMLFSIK